MDYEKKYKEALERTSKLRVQNPFDTVSQMIEHVFPELKESEDERIRKEITTYLKSVIANKGYEDKIIESWLTWLEKQGKQKFADGTFVNVDDIREDFIQEVYRVLDADSTNDRANQIIDAFDNLPTVTIEKQGEQKPTDTVEPKFHDGEWITNGDYTWKIVEVEPLDYILQSQDGNVVDDTISHVDEQFHSFTIKDAKDGDILATSAGAFIYNGNNGGGNFPGCYCGINILGEFKTGVESHWAGRKVYPATKEQRDFLFQKMKEVGYEWDAEKKELRKVEEDLTEFENTLANVCRGWIGEELGWKDYIIKNSFPLLELAKRQFDEYEPNMIQWKGDNLKEVISFTGKDENFDKWFKSFEEYEKYVHTHNDIFKLFNEDGSHYEVPVGAWIVKTPDGHNIASKAIFKNKSAKWSDEDEAKRNELIGLIEGIKTQPLKTLEDWDGYISWLKSLRPQNRWKPSDKQMKAIEHICDGNFNVDLDILDSIYRDFKKLREE